MQLDEDFRALFGAMIVLMRMNPQEGELAAYYTYR